MAADQCHFKFSTLKDDGDDERISIVQPIGSTDRYDMNLAVIVIDDRRNELHGRSEDLLHDEMANYYVRQTINDRFWRSFRRNLFSDAESWPFVCWIGSELVRQRSSIHFFSYRETQWSISKNRVEVGIFFMILSCCEERIIHNEKMREVSRFNGF